MYVFVGQIPEVSSFRDVLADNFVGVLDGPFLPGGVTVRKVYGCLQSPGYPPVPAELHAVVRSYGKDILPVRPQQSCDSLGHGIRILALRKPLHDEVVPAPLAQGQNRALLAFVILHRNVEIFAVGKIAEFARFAGGERRKSPDRYSLTERSEH